MRDLVVALLVGAVAPHSIYRLQCSIEPSHSTKFRLLGIGKYDNLKVNDEAQSADILGDFGAPAVCLVALTIAAEGGKSDIAKPMKGLGSGVLEIALPH